MGQAGARRVSERFRWDRVAARTEASYLRALGSGWHTERPADDMSGRRGRRTEMVAG
jgi:hypothetical protein